MTDIAARLARRERWIADHAQDRAVRQYLAMRTLRDMIPKSFSFAKLGRALAEPATSRELAEHWPELATIYPGMVRYWPELSRRAGTDKWLPSTWEGVRELLRHEPPPHAPLEQGALRQIFHRGVRADPERGDHPGRPKRPDRDPRLDGPALE